MTGFHDILPPEDISWEWSVQKSEEIGRNSTQPCWWPSYLLDESGDVGLTFPRRIDTALPFFTLQPSTFLFEDIYIDSIPDYVQIPLSPAYIVSLYTALECIDSYFILRVLISSSRTVAESSFYIVGFLGAPFSASRGWYNIVETGISLDRPIHFIRL